MIKYVIAHNFYLCEYKSILETCFGCSLFANQTFFATDIL